MGIENEREFTLKERIEIFKFSQMHSIRLIADHFKTSIGTIQRIKRNATKLLDLEKTSSNLEYHRIPKETQLEKVNKKTYEFFQIARSKNIPISGPLLIETAKIFAEKEGLEFFKGSLGWLDKFKKRYKIVSRVLMGEADDADKIEADLFIKNFKDLRREYTLENIFNVDETGVFYKGTLKTNLQYSIGLIYFTFTKK